MGTSWADQKPGRSTAEFMAALILWQKQRVVATGGWDLTDLDHNSPNYNGVSNKELMIHARILNDGPITDYQHAVRVVLRTLGYL